MWLIRRIYYSLIFFALSLFFFLYIYCIYLKNMSAEQADTTKRATGGEGMLPLCE